MACGNVIRLGSGLGMLPGNFASVTRIVDRAFLGEIFLWSKWGWPDMTESQKIWPVKDKHLQVPLPDFSRDEIVVQEINQLATCYIASKWQSRTWTQDFWFSPQPSVLWPTGRPIVSAPSWPATRVSGVWPHIGMATTDCLGSWVMLA